HNYLEVRKQLCYPYYLRITESDHNSKNKLSANNEKVIVELEVSIEIDSSTKIHTKLLTNDKIKKLSDDKLVSLIEKLKKELEDKKKDVNNVNKLIYNNNKNEIIINRLKSQWIASQKTELLNFDKIDLLSVHCYDNAIREIKQERSMERVRLVGIKESNLYSLDNYLNALEMILSVNQDIERANNYIIPVVANWPRQLFI
ncbi:24857_t:CDS:2, partial [Dentiscutata erythropus]